MYKVFDKDGELIAQMEEVHYLKRKTQTLDEVEYKYWVRCKEQEAECIWIDGVKYSIMGKPAVEGAPVEVYVKEVEVAAELLKNSNDITILSQALTLMAQEIVERSKGNG